MACAGSPASDQLRQQRPLTARWDADEFTALLVGRPTGATAGPATESPLDARVVARIVSGSRQKYSAAWIYGYAASDVPVLLPPQAFVTMMMLRYRADIYSLQGQPTCLLCNKAGLSADGAHVLGCVGSGVHNALHNRIRDVIAGFCAGANLHPHIEEMVQVPHPQGLGLRLRPDIAVSNPHTGVFQRPVLLDVAITCPLQDARAITLAASLDGGWAAEYAVTVKDRKYAAFLASYNAARGTSGELMFVPLVVESFGAWDNRALEFFRVVAQRHARRLGQHTFVSMQTMMHRLGKTLAQGMATKLIAGADREGMLVPPPPATAVTQHAAHAMPGYAHSRTASSRAARPSRAGGAAAAAAATTPRASVAASPSVGRNAAAGAPLQRLSRNASQDSLRTVLSQVSGSPAADGAVTVVAARAASATARSSSRVGTSNNADAAAGSTPRSRQQQPQQQQPQPQRTQSRAASGVAAADAAAAATVTTTTPSRPVVAPHPVTTAAAADSAAAAPVTAPDSSPSLPATPRSSAATSSAAPRNGSDVAARVSSSQRRPSASVASDGAVLPPDASRRPP
jgi:hypothetical protein